jgi:hypothetical protein
MIMRNGRDGNVSAWPNAGAAGRTAAHKTDTSKHRRCIVNLSVIACDVTPDLRFGLL